MALRADNTYEIIWDTKPLGFSIVMDTTGRNAYVSSIQKKENLQKGLKLAAQIIAINGTNVKGMKHQKILENIKGASLPMTLVFQPRSFATEPRREEEEVPQGPPEGLLFGGAPDSAKNRVDGVFELTDLEVNERSVWQRKDDQDDPILLWWWPAKDLNEGLDENLWMISRKSQLNTQNAYACCPADVEFPNLSAGVPWKVWNMDRGQFVECELSIAAEVNTAEEALDEQ